MIRLFCHRFGIIFRCQIFKKQGWALSIVLGYTRSQFKSMGRACGLLASLGTRAHVFRREQPRGYSLAPGLWLRALAGPTPPPRTSVPAPRTWCQRLGSHPSPPVVQPTAAPPVVQWDRGVTCSAAHHGTAPLGGPCGCLAHMGLLAHAPLVCHMAHQFFLNFLYKICHRKCFIKINCY